MKLSEIALKIGGKLLGPDVELSGVSDLEIQKEGTIAYAENKKNAELLGASAVSALLLKNDLPTSGKPAIFMDDPKLAFIKVLELFNPYQPYRNAGQDFPNVFIGKNVKIGKNVVILPFTTIMDNTVIGDNTTIYSNCFIGRNVQIGENCLFKSGVRIDDGTIIGKRVSLMHNCVIGGDGYGYLQRDGRNIKIPHIGRVVIKDDVEIGAGVTIDRAEISETVIGEDVKIDNLVMIGHNVKIGEHSIIISQVGISGSSTVGKNCILAGQVGVADHVRIGDGAVILAQAGIEGNVEPGAVLFGSPARNVMEMKRIYAALPKLLELLKRVKILENKIGPLDAVGKEVEK